jgi:hypothetical protein
VRVQAGWVLLPNQYRFDAQARSRSPVTENRQIARTSNHPGRCGQQADPLRTDYGPPECGDEFLEMRAIVEVLQIVVGHQAIGIFIPAIDRFMQIP